MTLVSEGQKDEVLRQAKKLERQKGQRIRQGLYPSGFDPKATSEKKVISAGVEGKTVTGRKEPYDPGRQDCGEENALRRWDSAHKTTTDNNECSSNTDGSWHSRDRQSINMRQQYSNTDTDSITCFYTNADSL